MRMYGLALNTQTVCILSNVDPARKRKGVKGFVKEFLPDGALDLRRAFELVKHGMLLADGHQAWRAGCSRTWES